MGFVVSGAAIWCLLHRVSGPCEQGHGDWMCCWGFAPLLPQNLGGPGSASAGLKPGVHLVCTPGYTSQVGSCKSPPQQPRWHLVNQGVDGRDPEQEDTKRVLLQNACWLFTKLAEAQEDKALGWSGDGEGVLAMHPQKAWRNERPD